VKYCLLEIPVVLCKLQGLGITDVAVALRAYERVKGSRMARRL